MFSSHSQVKIPPEFPRGYLNRIRTTPLNELDQIHFKFDQINYWVATCQQLPTIWSSNVSRNQSQRWRGWTGKQNNGRKSIALARNPKHEDSLLIVLRRRIRRRRRKRRGKRGTI